MWLVIAKRNEADSAYRLRQEPNLRSQDKVAKSLKLS